MMFRFCLFGWIVLLVGGSSVCSTRRAQSAEPESTETAAQKTEPALALLSHRCGECHAADAPELGLDLSTAASILAGSETGPVLVPSKPEQSLLVQVLGAKSKPHMPPDEQLTEEEIALVSRWVASLDPQLAAGEKQTTAADREHWAFQPVQRPALPVTPEDTWSRNPVDRFLLARLQGAGLTPSAEADRPTLLRRLYFDLIGLPPSPDDVAAFVADRSPQAYENQVEALLASPRYGERWGRHWLDLARYADSSGFHEDRDRPHAWRYRDYVIGAFNNDKPYSRFVVEQLAGDELPDATPESWIATAFARNGPSNETNMGMGVFLEKYRLDQLDDVVSTTSNVFLGLTLGCARCHDHKYDPLTQADYYSFLAVFDGAQWRDLELDSFQAEKPVLSGGVKPQPDKVAAMVYTDRGEKPRTTHILWRGDVQNRGPEVTPRAPSVLDRESWTVSLESPLPDDSPAAGRRLALANWIVDPQNPLTWRVMANRIFRHHFGQGLVATPSNFGRLSESPSHPQLLDWLAAELRDTDSVKGLHRLLVTSAAYRQQSQATKAGQAIDPDNRLLWRMNKRRLEAEPLRDALLALAGNLNETVGGPGVKPRIRPDLLVASQRNKWPVVEKEGPEHWRRSVYVYVKRQLQLPMLELFDAPSTNHSCAARPETLAPTQALLLMNDEFARDQARDFAARVQAEATDSLPSQVELAMRMALGREPTPARIATGVAFIEQQAARLAAVKASPSAAELAIADRDALADFCHVLMNLSEFAYVD
ncbi:PSD1 and planctomycete cytochrome C domain-containing protein [Lignipirellula cremea]|uniref:Planctomycete cytochrome C n=1 Tax=Lignipirellula cremea TaxID=2528010 RepID=A0A518DY13_9BACT|nr:PSD1 and planctomycete cytochrome C domain-containing protein [Lignipirellula cremea]QDU96742.1 Planctomycete cytochrome C [Lignipirellula cremea]